MPSSQTPTLRTSQPNSLNAAQLLASTPEDLAVIATNKQYQIPAHIATLNKRLLEIHMDVQ
jgi:hypothetical protein